MSRTHAQFGWSSRTKSPSSTCKCTPNISFRHSSILEQWRQTEGNSDSLTICLLFNSWIRLCRSPNGRQKYRFSTQPLRTNGNFKSSKIPQDLSWNWRSMTDVFALMSRINMQIHGQSDAFKFGCQTNEFLNVWPWNWSSGTPTICLITGWKA